MHESLSLRVPAQSPEAPPADDPAPPRRKPLRFWRFAAAGLLVVVALGPFINRELRLAGLPDIGQPFDTRQFGHVDVAPRNNAFELYALAGINLMPMLLTATYPDEDWMSLAWPDVPADLQGWLAQNRAALDHFREGSDRPEALYHQPASRTHTSNLNVVQNLRDLARLARLEAMRLEATGDAAGAWTWHRALLRSSRLSGMHGADVERVIGCALHYTAVNGIVRWSAQLEVDPAMLQSALDEVRAVDKMTTPPSELFKAEYLVYRAATVNIATAATFVDPQSYEGQFLAIPGLPWLYAEPEMSRRVANLVWANFLSQCDRPRLARMPAVTKTGLYSSDPGGPSPTAGIEPAELERWLRKTVVARELLPALEAMTISLDRERARQALLETALALELYYREQGEFPAELATLIGHGFDQLPADPFGTGEPLRYRQETDANAGASIWSIAQDQVDDGGLEQITLNFRQAGDIILRVVPPKKRGPSE